MKPSNRWLVGCIVSALAGFCLVAGVGAYLVSRLPPVTEQLPPDAAPIAVSISLPDDGQTLPAGQYLTVEASALGSQPISALQLWVDGMAVDARAFDPAVDRRQVRAVFSWLPGAAGHRTLLIRALDDQGRAVTSNLVRVSIAEQSQEFHAAYQPAEGDTLESIGRDFDVAPADLLRLNPSLNTAQPLAGQPLIVPVVLAGPSASVVCAASQPAGAACGEQAAPPVGETVIPAPVPAASAPPGAPAAPATEFTPSPIGFWLAGNFPEVMGGGGLPLAPELTLQVAGCTVNLAIVDKSSDETGFFVYRADPNSSRFTRVATLSPGDGSAPLGYSQPGLAGLSLYFVSAFNPAGEASSSIVSALIEQRDCAQPQQFGLALVGAKLTVATPVNRVYCYRSFDGGEYSRLPPAPDQFVQARDGAFDLSPYLNLLSASLPAANAALKLECWGWSGSDLQALGAAEHLFGPDVSDGPIQIAGAQFAVAANVSTRGLFAAAIPAAVVSQSRAIPPGTAVPLKIVPAPYGLRGTYDSGAQEVSLTWAWDEFACAPAPESTEECSFVNDVAGYRVYGSSGAAVLTVADPNQHEARISPVAAGSLAVADDCYTVTAFTESLESARSDEQCVTADPGQLSSNNPPSAAIARPANLRLASDAQECSQGFAAPGPHQALCQFALEQSAVVLVWDWPAAGDSQGFHVYRSGALAQTVSQSSERVAILPPASPGKCYSVRAFKGNLESEPSDNLCTGDNPAEPSQVAFGPAILLAYARAEVEQGLGSPCLLPHKTWTIASAEKVDGASQPASVGFRHSFGSSLGACEKQTNLVLRAHVVYDISSLIGRHVSGAVLKTTLTSSLSTQRQDVGAPQAVSSDGCATGLYGADYAPGETALNPSQPIGSYPQGGPVDVTAWVQSQVAGAKQFAAFVLSSNEAYAKNFDACLSAYLFNELSVTLSP